jgi:hypothetical protein
MKIYLHCADDYDGAHILEAYYNKRTAKKAADDRNEAIYKGKYPDGFHFIGSVHEVEIKDAKNNL